jgi:hypothetical protein
MRCVGVELNAAPAFVTVAKLAEAAAIQQEKTRI